MAKINANYEAVYILQPDLSEEQIAALVAKFKAVVEANGPCPRSTRGASAVWPIPSTI